MSARRGKQGNGAGAIVPAPSWIPLGAAISYRSNLQQEVIETIKLCRAHAAHSRADLGSEEISITNDDGVYWSGLEVRFGLGSLFFRDDGRSIGHLTNDLDEACKWISETIHSDEKTNSITLHETLRNHLNHIAKTVENFVCMKLKDDWREGRIQLFGRCDSESAPYEELPNTMWRRAELSRALATLKSDAGGPTFFDVHIEAAEDKAAPTTTEPATQESRKNTIASQKRFEARVNEIVDNSPFKRTKSVREFIALGETMEISRRAAIQIRATVLSQKSEQTQLVWKKSGRRKK